jgi:hypothetical protein
MEVAKGKALIGFFRQRQDLPMQLTVSLQHLVGLVRESLVASQKTKKRAACNTPFQDLTSNVSGYTDLWNK